MENNTHARVVERLNELKNLSTTELGRMERALLRSQTYAKVIVQIVHQPLVVLNEDLRVVMANPAFCQTFQVPVGDVEGRLIYELCDGQWEIPRLQKLLEKMLPEQNQIRDFELEHEFSKIGLRTMMLNAQRIVWDEEDMQTILLSFDDITDLRKAEKVLKGIPESVAKQIKKRTSDLQVSHEKLQKELSERCKSEDEMRQACETLKKKLEKRNTDMEALNEEFRRETAERRKSEEELRMTCKRLERELEERAADIKEAHEKFQKETEEPSRAVEMLRKNCEALEHELESRSAELQTIKEQLQTEIKERRKAVEMLHSLEEVIDGVFNSIEGKLDEVGRGVHVGLRDKEMAA